MKSIKRSFGEPSAGAESKNRKQLRLALWPSADAILLDHRKATKEAKGQGLTVVGTLAILGKAAEQGLLNLREGINELRKKTNFRMPPAEVIEGMLQRDTNLRAGRCTFSCPLEAMSCGHACGQRKVRMDQ